MLERAGLAVERVFKVKEGRPNVVDLIKGDRIQLIINTPRGQDTFFDEKAIRRAAVLARDSDDHDDCRGTGCGGGNCGDAAAQHHGLCAAESACIEGRLNPSAKLEGN